MSEKTNATKYDAHLLGVAAGDVPICWHCPRQSPFAVCGLGWFARDGAWRRLPVTPPRPLPEAVDALANHTAGAQIRFRTDSGRVGIKVTLSGSGAYMSHMAPTGIGGVDCYVDGRFVNTSKYDHQRQDYDLKLFGNLPRRMRSVALYLPLYQGVKSVEVGLDPDARAEAPEPFVDDLPVVIYGTSITQGGCASRPGMAYTSILGRRLNREFVNLGFSGSGKGEPEVAEAIATIPQASLFVLDYCANTATADKFAATLPRFIEILRAWYPATPVLVLSRVPFAQDLINAGSAEAFAGYRRAGETTVSRLTQAGVRGLYFHDMSEAFGADAEECTVDGVHPTDLGFMRMAEHLAPVIAALTRRVT